jgi:hypothetical protein
LPLAPNFGGQLAYGDNGIGDGKIQGTAFTKYY